MRVVNRALPSHCAFAAVSEVWAHHERAVPNDARVEAPTGSPTKKRNRKKEPENLSRAHGKTMQSIHRHGVDYVFLTTQRY